MTPNWTRRRCLLLSRTFGVLALVMFGMALASRIRAQTVGDPLDLTNLPIGDYKVSDTPQVGYVYRCGMGADEGVGGAQVAGPWIRADDTFDFTAKAIVDGEVEWNQHRYTIMLDGDLRRIEGNNLPDHTTGVYPIAPSDDAYAYDRNPNRITEQALIFALPTNPIPADTPNCLAPGAVAILDSGVVVYDALDALTRDAVAHETQDSCQGHPQIEGQYHYHSLTACIDDSGDGHSARVGYALDGFGLYGVRGEDGAALINADLDECHGHTHDIEWDGERVEMYHYHATYEYPYTVGCFHGTSAVTTVPMGGQPPAGGQAPASGQGAPPNGQPDLAAAAARLGISERQLRDALGPPPPDLAAAAARLGISEAELRAALDVP
jgi:hypothetical protein